MTDSDEKWCHFLMDDKTPVDVPASFIEGYDSDMKLETKKIYNVFWSPEDKDTPETVTEDGRPIVYVSKLSKKAPCR